MNDETKERLLVKSMLEHMLLRDWGPRCIVKDTEEFPELIGDTKSSRCPSCVVYEKFDDFWGYFAHEDSNNS